jgi:hypothetical protein
MGAIASIGLPSRDPPMEASDTRCVDLVDGLSEWPAPGIWTSGDPANSGTGHQEWEKSLPEEQSIWRMGSHVSPGSSTLDGKPVG